MAYTVRYQVFLSSTYTDLKEERAEVIQALWELDCIPTGMEAFLASNASQWDIIKKVIDECDYYILILGGRYGSVTAENIGYTEKEFDYAKSIGLPILAFVHSSPEDIPAGKSEKDPALASKLADFRAKVMAEFPVRGWTTSEQLGSVASRSLIQEIRRNPRLGWIKNDGQSPVDLLERIASLSKENADLTAKLASFEQSGPTIKNLSKGGDKVDIEGNVRLRDSSYTYTAREWSAHPSWDNIFAHIGSALVNEGTEKDIESKLKGYVALSDEFPFGNLSITSTNLYSRSLAKVLVQFRALGLIKRGEKKRAVTDKESYWKLTEAGDDHLVNLLASRTKKGEEEIFAPQEVED